MRFLTFLVWLTFAPLLAGADKPTLSASTGPARRSMAVGEFDRVIPLLLDGGGWKTSIVFTNLDTKTLYLALFFNAGDGGLLVVPVASLGPSVEIIGTLPANQSMTLETEGSGDSVREGYASFFTLDRPADDPNAKLIYGRIGVIAVIRGTPPDRPGFETVIPATSNFENRFTLPFDHRRGFRTSIVLLNASTRSSPVNIVVRDGQGNVLARDSATLEGGQRAAGMLTEIYPQTADQAGVVQVSTFSLALSGLGLRIDPTGAFAAIPTLSSDIDPDAPSLPSTPPSTLPGISAATCSALEGALVFANDGQFLGKITSNSFAADSLGNTFGLYGNQFSSVSIFNTFGKYGSEYSPLSAFNPLASTPPIIYIGGKPVAYLTVNPSRTPRVDPRAIYPCIGR